MTNLHERIDAAIRHIQTAVDVDPWAVELAEQALRYMEFMSAQHNCNDCGVKDCSIRPELGHSGKGELLQVGGEK